MTVWGWLLLLSGVVLASLPFATERFFLGAPLFKQAKLSYWRALEFIVAYAIFIALGRWIEGSISQNTVQGWAFYAVTFLLFVVAGFPAFIWRYLWQKNERNA